MSRRILDSDIRRRDGAFYRLLGMYAGKLMRSNEWWGAVTRRGFASPTTYQVVVTLKAIGALVYIEGRSSATIYRWRPANEVVALWMACRPGPVRERVRCCDCQRWILVEPGRKLRDHLDGDMPCPGGGREAVRRQRHYKLTGAGV